MPNVLLRVALAEFVKFNCESTLDRLPRATDGINLHQRWRIPKLRRIYPCVPRFPNLLYNGELPNNIAARLKSILNGLPTHVDGQRRPHRKPSAACVQW